MENKVRMLIREVMDSFFNDMDVDTMSQEDLDAYIQFQVDKQTTRDEWKKDLEADLAMPSAQPVEMTNLNNEE